MKKYKVVIYNFLSFIPDKAYLKLIYFIRFHKRLNLEEPKTFNEKMQWLKLYDRNPKYIDMVDKCSAKEFVTKIIGEEYIIPTIGIYNSFDEINFEQLPNQFVIKCTHDSNGLIICRDKKQLNIDKAKKDINTSLYYNYYYGGREWPYKNVKPRIIIEKYMNDGKNDEINDYKCFCFNGKVEYIQVDYDRFKNHGRNEYDRDWNYIPFTTDFPTDKNRIIEKPKKLKLLIELVEKIVKNIGIESFVRIDMYIVKDKIYFGEITFYPGSGFLKFEPSEYDKKIGDLVNINKN